MFQRQKVWVPDSGQGFIQGRIVDIGIMEATVSPTERGKPNFMCGLDRVYPAEEDDNKEVDDNCGLMYLNEATLLHNIRLRYNKDKIYLKGLYSSETIKKYKGKSLGTMPPHVFAIADKAFRDMRVLKQSQSIIVSGESGAGKTESTKHLLRYMCDHWGSSAGPVEQKILDGTEVKTTRNNNSSRFGKFIEVHFDAKYQVVGGFISHYLLEKSRICMQGPEERNYHVFFQLCAGAPEQLRAQLHLTKPDDFHYLKNGCTQYFVNKTTEGKLNNAQKSQSFLSKGPLKDPMLDDIKDFSEMDKALSRLGLSDADKMNIYGAVASVLHLGNVSFEENPEDTKGGCRAQFIEKNNDALHASLEGIVQESKNPFVRKLFALTSGGSQGQQKGKLNFISVGSKFRSQLEELMEKLRSTGTNFIRCIKPNLRMIDHSFEGGSILSQLQCSGMTSVLELMQQGYPSRAPFSELYSMYSKFLPPKLARLDPRFFCKALFQALGLNENDFRFGLTKIFFRPGKFAEFDEIMKSDPASLAALVAKVQKWLIQSRWKKAQYSVWSVIKLKYKILYRRENLVIIQKNIRMHVVRKQHQPRYRGIMQINSLQAMLTRMEDIIGQMKRDKDSSAADVKKLKSDMQAAVQRIKTNPRIKPEEVSKLHANLMAQANNSMAALQKKLQTQKVAEEQERLRRIQEEMEQERKRKEEEETRKREEEENRRNEVEENSRYREQVEQERRDHELALRLAQDTHGQVDDISVVRRSETARAHQAAQQKGKYDLSKWKYSELRDTINTSCDIELLEACRVEFHRRLKVYHAWKAKNKRRSTMDENERAPRSVMEQANKPTMQRVGSKQPVIPDKDRYFRIPFIRPGSSLVEQGNKRGWWYAHFDGQFVARQMELHPDKPAILLVAGVDDMQMCELSLDETGLTRKRGAEILEHEFNREWEKHGGGTYKRPATRINNNNNISK
ncbi:hypothetical protein B566_EDAN007441 [Ephemera danica]|nr:hypothetical protein B566_EDAN007441 [Ephemera danica]